MENYFEVLRLDKADSRIKCSNNAELENLLNQDEQEFKVFTEEIQAQFQKEYLRLDSGVNNPYERAKIPDKQQKLSEAKEVLLHRETRDKHIRDLLTRQPDPPKRQPQERQNTPNPPENQPQERQNTPSIIRFGNGAEVDSIPQLATLIEKNVEEATDMLYQGDALEKALQGAGETAFAQAANAVVRQFSRERDIGLTAMVAVLRGQVSMKKGNAASTPKQLARLIDKNWDQGKTLLYNGFFAFWLTHVNQRQLAATANEITNRYSEQQDIGLEAFVQGLDPGIGRPMPEISSREIYINGVNTGRKKTISSKIKNIGRGFLYGEVHLTNDIPGLQVSDTDIYGEGIVTIDLDGDTLTLDQAHRTSLVIKTNGEDMEVPIYINRGIQRLLFSVVISGVLMAALAFFTRFIVTQLPYTVWAGTLVLGIGIYAHWLLVVTKSFSWQRFLMPIMPIKNFFRSRHFSKLTGVLKRIREGTAVALTVGAILVALTFLFVALTFVGTYVFMGLDKLFYLGFNINILIGWAFWGLVIGLAIRGYRALKTYDQKQMRIWVVVLPILLLCLVVTIRAAYVSASKFLNTGKTTPIVAQSQSELETETITPEEPDPISTKQSTAKSDGGPILLSTIQKWWNALQVSSPGEETPAPLPPTTQSEPETVTPKQETTATPTREPEPTNRTAPSEPARIKRTAIDKPEKKFIPSKASVPVTKREVAVPPPPTTLSEPETVTPKQETPTIPTPKPKPITPSIPSDMILIPAGEFQMGSNENSDEKPVHTVYIDAFYIDTYEVTNAQYKVFVDANPQWRKDQILSEYHNGNYLKHWNGNNYPTGKAEHPVTYVSWYGAMAYAQWVGKRLPTEAEWEKAARGGKSGLQYPWGNTISNGQANYGNHVGGTTAVGNYAANAYGLSDMAGNVLEWCLDAYYGDFYSASPRRNPLAGVNTIENADLIISGFTAVTTSRVARGGAWYNTEIQNIRVAYRNRVSPTLTNIALGFRCVKALTPSNRD